MSDRRYWSREFLTEFIEIYKKHPALWNSKSRQYTNKTLKNIGFEDLIQHCRKIYPEADKDSVTKHIQSIRSCFRKERSKIERSKRNSSSKYEEYVPSLWYYDLLLFIKDHDISSESFVKTEEDDVDTVEFVETEYEERKYLYDNMSENSQFVNEDDTREDNYDEERAPQVNLNNIFSIRTFSIIFY